MKSMCLLSILIAAGAMADEPAPSRVPPELRSCVGIQRSAERLACFDRAVAVLAGRAEPTAAPSPESTFGLNASPEPLAAAATQAERQDLPALTAKVVKLGHADDGSAVIVLDNGQSWRQLSSRDTLLKVGDEVTINRGALGSFQMVVPSGRSAKVKRTQ